MKLEEICCSLELAEKLYNLGVKQDSIFYLSREPLGMVKIWRRGEFENHEVKKYYSAFTAAELGEILFNHLYEISTEENENEFNQDKYYLSTKDHGIGFMADTEVNARAKMIIYLIENGIVKP